MIFNLLSGCFFGCKLFTKFRLNHNEQLCGSKRSTAKNQHFFRSESTNVENKRWANKKGEQNRVPLEGIPYIRYLVSLPLCCTISIVVNAQRGIKARAFYAKSNLPMAGGCCRGWWARCHWSIIGSSFLFWGFMMSTISRVFFLFGTFIGLLILLLLQTQ